jgi:hypothetical protein
LPGGATITSTPSGDAREFAREVGEATRMAGGLVPMLHWARSDGRAIAGTVLILAVLAEIPGPDSAPAAWLDVASVNGEWQPGLLMLAGRIRDRLESGATVAQLLAWMVQHLVIRPHERNAYSKLPDFTFRWRWEAGRLRFYDHPIDWDDLGDLRSEVLASLLVDLGFLEGVDGRIGATADGRALIADVFT